MATFEYKARGTDGQLVSGAVTAETLDEAARMLRTEGRFVVDIEAIGTQLRRVRWMDAFSLRSRVKRDDVIQFTQQLAIMLQTGVSVGESLTVASQQVTHEGFRAVLDQVTEAVESGECLSKALGRHPRVFPGVMTALVRASEATGSMGDMLDRVSQYLAKERQITKTVRGALIYPAFMLCMAIAVTVFLLLFVLPRFTTIYQGRGAALPGPTRMLMWMSDVGLTYWYAWGAGIIVGGIGLWLFKRSPRGTGIIDALKVRLPVMRGIFRSLYLARSTQTMSTLLAAGVSMLEMIDITRAVVGNVWYKQLWEHVQDKVCQGSQLSDSLRGTTLFPSAFPSMLHAGERSGQMDRVLRQIAKFSEEEFEEAVRRATQFIEPLMIIVMGAIIGFIAISLLLPIFTVGRVMSGG